MFHKILTAWKKQKNMEIYRRKPFLTTTVKEHATQLLSDHQRSGAHQWESPTPALREHCKCAPGAENDVRRESPCFTRFSLRGKNKKTWRFTAEYLS